MDTPSGQVNTIKQPANGNGRIEKINNLVDTQVSSILTELDTVGRDLEAVMDILTDRVVQSTEPGFPIALARIGELRVETLKKKIDVLKTLVSDKGNELSTKKRSNMGSGSELGDILSGVSLGAALGAKMGSQLSLPERRRTDYDTIDTSQEEVIVETEHMNLIGLTPASVETLLSGE